MSEKDTLDMKLLLINNNNLQLETINSFKNNLWKNNFINLAWYETLKSFNQDMEDKRVSAWVHSNMRAQRDQVNQSVPTVKQPTFLGVTFDSFMTFKHHAYLPSYQQISIKLLCPHLEPKPQVGQFQHPPNSSKWNFPHSNWLC